MKEIIITPEELLKFMTKDSYNKFIKQIKKELKSNEPIWILAQVLEQKDYF